MVMLGSHYSISYFPSQEIKYEATWIDLKANDFVNEEYLDTHEMNSSSPMDNLELVPFDLDCPVVANSPCITDIKQDFFPIVDGLFIETSCSEDSCDLFPASNHEYVMQYISDSHIL